MELPKGSYSNDLEVVGPKVVGFYQGLFSCISPHPFSGLLDVISLVITKEDNCRLIAVSLAEAVWQAVLWLDPDSAPGPDRLRVISTYLLGILWVVMC